MFESVTSKPVAVTLVLPVTETAVLAAWVTAGVILYFGALFVGGLRPGDLLSAPTPPSGGA